MPRSNDFCESTQPEDSCQASQSAQERKRGGEGDGGWQKIKIGSAQNRLTQLARPFATSIHSERETQTDRQTREFSNFARKNMPQNPLGNISQRVHKGCPL